MNDKDARRLLLTILKKAVARRDRTLRQGYICVSKASQKQYDDAVAAIAKVEAT